MKYLRATLLTDIPSHTPVCGLCCARPTAEMTCRSVEDIRPLELDGKRFTLRRKGTSIRTRMKTYLTHMPVLGGMACTNIRFGMMWLSKPVNSLRYCFLLLWSAATLRLSVAWPCGLPAGYFLLDEDILDFMTTSTGEARPFLHTGKALFTVSKS